MKVNELAKRTGINLETIRYYEKEGILPEPKRAANGYRVYDEQSVAQVNFIKSCRALGFSLDDIRQLNALKFRTADHYAADEIVLNQLAQVQGKIAQLQEIQTFLQSIANSHEHSADECKALSGLVTKA